MNAFKCSGLKKTDTYSTKDFEKIFFLTNVDSETSRSVGFP